MFGLEKLLGEEIDTLGFKRTQTMDGRVFFSGDENACARANVNLRVAERVYVLAGEPFIADSFDALFEGSKAIEWENYITNDDSFPVSGHSIKSKLTSIPNCQKIIKKAIAVRLGEKYGVSVLPENGNICKIEFFIFKDLAYLMIDTSGVALHKRGYRPVANAAPLRETLAAAMALTARIRPDIFLWDPFCGSGTIAIEGALIATKRAPGLHRSFSGEKLSFIPSSSWTLARDEAFSLIDNSSQYRGYGSDINPECIETAISNADRAGVGKHIKFFVADAQKISKPEFDCKGTLICNPPYGERMMSMRDAENLYKNVGKCFAEMSPWQIYILTSCEYFERLYGRKADRVRKLYNGTIPSFLYQFYKPTK
jgi:putative N6-adenine-specific DNA methylase